MRHDNTPTPDRNRFADTPRPAIASLAHQRAGQVVSLRELARRIDEQCTTVAQAAALARSEAARLEGEVVLMAASVEARHV